MTRAIEMPEVPAAQRGEGEFSLRYEDVTQDGRLRLEPISHAIGAAIWRNVFGRDPLIRRLASDSILPILARLRIEGGEGPIGVLPPVRCCGALEWLRVRGDRGRVRVRMDTTCEVMAPRGRTFGPRPEGAGEPISAGWIRAEHVLTRPFAVRAEDRVLEELPGGWPAELPRREAALETSSSVLALPEDAEPIDETFALDPCPLVLGLDHTDSNQHVNSLVYPRILEEAALRRFHALGLPVRVMARSLDLAFRKPCFAGDCVHVLLRAYRHEGGFGVLGAFVGQDEAASGAIAPSERAHGYARMTFAL